MRLWLYLSNENDEERMLRHKGDLPTTETDTNFIAEHKEREGEDGDHYMSHIPTSKLQIMFVFLS